MKEIFETEKKYIQNLELVINNVILPIRQKKIVTNFNDIEDFLTVFSNLESIKILHEKLFERLNKKYSNYYHFSSFGAVFQEFLPFFKLYFIYCEEFGSNMKFLTKFRKSNEKIGKFIEKLEYQSMLNNQDLNSLLIMPVQRICKYVLLLKDLIRYTEIFHPDYASLQKSLTLFTEINIENNQKMDKCIKNLKLIELQKIFGSDKNEILDVKRDFICEESFEIIINSKAIPTIVYIMTDLILITERINFLGIYKLLFMIFIDENSTVKSLQNTKYFNDLFSLQCSSNSVTFLAGSLENKEKYMKLFGGLIDSMKNIFENKLKTLQMNPHLINTTNARTKCRMSLDLEINVMGTEERIFEGLINQTVYIIEIKTNYHNQRIYMSYGEIYEIFQKAKENFPEIYIPKMKRLNLFHKKTKTIETRKIMIENFFLTLLKNEHVQDNGEFFIKALNLPLDFFNFANRNSLPLEKFRSSCKNIENSLNDTPEKKIKKNRRSEALTSMSKILIDSNEKLKNGNFFFSTDRGGYKIEKKGISVRLIDNSQIEIKISHITTALEACEIIAKEIKLRFFEDFKLYLMDTKNEYKLLEDDEVLFKYFFEQETNKAKESNNFLINLGQKIKNSINFKQFFKGKTTLIFKKYIFLPKDLEQTDWISDVVRTRLIAFQVLNGISQNKFILSFNEYCLFAAFYGLELYGSYNENIVLNDALKAIKNMIPQEIYNGKAHEFWNVLITKKWKKLSEKFEEKISQNKKSNTKSIFEINIIQLIQKNELFGVTLFETEIYKNKDLPNIVVLGIKYNGILILSKDKAKQFFFIPYEEIKNLVVYPKSIIFEFQERNLRINTNKSFEISQLINTYKKFLNFLKE